MGLLFDVPAIPALAALTGSEAQLKWANQVRPKKLAHCREEIRRMEVIAEHRAVLSGTPAEWGIARRRILAAKDRLRRLESITSAHEWIEMRDRTVGELLGLEEDA